MNREILIRVWDTEEKTMSPLMPLPMLAGYLLGTKERKPNGLGKEIYQQWSGLKDKNGVAICETDLIKLDDSGECFVGFVKDSACFALVSPDKKVATPLTLEVAKTCTVFGNIFQKAEDIQKNN